MKIVLIASLLMDYFDGSLHPISMDKLRECPPYGIYLLGTILQDQGYDVVIVDLVAQGSNSLSSFKEDIEGANLIGISATSLSWPTAVDCIKQIRRIDLDIPIVLGGVHPTMFDEYILSAYPVDFVIRGEGEIALPLLVKTLECNGDLNDVPSLTRKQGNSISRTKLHKAISGEEMGNLPIPDYNNIPLEIYTGLSIESSRGCPFNCSFCSTSYRGSWRGIPAEVFVDRIEQVLPFARKTKVGYVQIIDDEFTANRKRALNITKCLQKRNIDVSLVFDSRANDLIHEKFVESIAPYAYRFLVGAECGYNEGLKRIGKGTTCENLEKAAAIANKYGISNNCDFSFILGLPWETKKEVLKTIRFACRLYTKYGVRVMLQWYCMIPGSKLWDIEAKKSNVNASIYDNYGFFRNSYLFLSGVNLTPDEIWEISDCISPVLKLSAVADGGTATIQYAVPEPIVLDFKREALNNASYSALLNCRELTMNAKSK